METGRLEDLALTAHDDQDIWIEGHGIVARVYSNADSGRSLRSLFIAAPAVLKALKVMVDADAAGDYSRWKKAVDAARAAIAQAEGEAEAEAPAAMPLSALVEPGAPKLDQLRYWPYLVWAEDHRAWVGEDNWMRSTIAEAKIFTEDDAVNLVIKRYGGAAAAIKVTPQMLVAIRATRAHVGRSTRQ